MSKLNQRRDAARAALDAVRQHEERLAQQKWFQYAKMHGMFLPDWEEDRFYTDEQEGFFAEYERQMDPGV